MILYAQRYLPLSAVLKNTWRNRLGGAAWLSRIELRLLELNPRHFRKK